MALHTSWARIRALGIGFFYSWDKCNNQHDERWHNFGCIVKDIALTRKEGGDHE